MTAARLPPMLPAPLQARASSGAFRLRPDQPICLPPASDERVATAAEVLRDGIAARTGRRLPLECHARLEGLGPHLGLALDAGLARALVGRGVSPALSRQAYQLYVDGQRVSLRAATEAGLRHGVETLLQLVDGRGRVRACEIEDHPVLERRGLLLDISRGKVPTQAELLRLVELCARLKLNVLMLYTEHTFQFRRHPQIGRDAAPLSAEALRALDAHAWRHGMELVPCLQSLGHMEHVLKLPRYAGLAESDRRWSLAPSDPATYALLDDLYAEYLPNFRSPLLNANCDEPWDLGEGRSAEMARRKGRDGVYLHHLQRVQKLAKRHGKRTLVWGDVLRNYPALIDRLDRKLLVLDWWYEAHWSYDRVRKWAECGLTFWVCPGTSSWNALFPRVSNSLANISGWAQAARSHGAQGLLLTDWGDFGHYNLLGNSLLAYAWAAQEAWSGPAPSADFDRAFSRLLFGSSNPDIAKLYRGLGDLHEVGFRIPNGSPLSFLFFDPVHAGTFVRRADARVLRRTRTRLEVQAKRLHKLVAQGAEAEQTHAELSYAVDATRFAIDKSLAALAYHRWLAEPTSLNAAARRRLASELTALAQAQRQLGRRLLRLWRARSELEGFVYTRRRLDGSVRSLRAAASRLTRNAPRAAPPLAPLTLQQAVDEMRQAIAPL